MEDWKKNFKPEDFKIDPRQMDDLRLQMDKFNQSLPRQFKAHPNLDNLMIQRTRVIRIRPYNEKIQRQQMDQLKRQMEEMQALGFGDHV